MYATQENKDASGVLRSSYLTGPEGTAITRDDADASQPYKSVTEIYDNVGNLQGSVSLWDDGSKDLYEADTQNEHAWLFYQRHVDVNGNIAREYVKWDDGTSTHVQREFGPGGTTQVVSNFTATGALATQEATFPDGRSEHYQHDVLGDQPWSIQFTVRDADGVIIRQGTRGDDGAFAINGAAGSDTLTGSAGNDVLRGDAGSDTLDGGTGADITDGGLGDDIHYVDTIDDVVLEATGEGRDRVYTSANFNLRTGVEVGFSLSPIRLEQIPST